MRATYIRWCALRLDKSNMADEPVTYNSTENVVVYSSADNAVHLDVQLADETVWLTQKQMAGFLILPLRI